MDSQGNEPQVYVRQVACAPASGNGRWRITWQIENRGPQPLQLLTTRLPHGQFRREEQHLEPPVAISAKESAAIQLEVAAAERSRTIVENAFLILQVIWLHRLWRILARLRVSFAENGAPAAVTEAVTAQRVGFSKELSPES